MRIESHEIEKIRPRAVLMYHEVLDIVERKKQKRAMAPPYCLSVNQFHGQMIHLKHYGYYPLTIDELCADRGCDNHRSVAITFDDGLVGNYEFAFPILQKLNIKATFYIIASRIGRPRYLRWQQVCEMLKAGMVIGSHTMTHIPLERESEESIYYELRESKTIIEENTRTPVNHLSLPHGSINERILNIAREVGYWSVCTSKIGYGIARQSPILIDRIPVLDSYDIEIFARITSGDPRVIKRMALTKGLKNALKTAIGIDNYRRIYRSLYRIHVSEKD